MRKRKNIKKENELKKKLLYIQISDIYITSGIKVFLIYACEICTARRQPSYIIA